jgi:hypothetical protein
MNTELFEKVKVEFRKEPRRVQMRDWLWVSQVPILIENSEFPECGTVGCIAGITCVVAYREANEGFRDAAVRVKQEAFNSFEDKAVELLDITHTQGRRLCHLSDWPAEFFEAYTDAEEAGDKIKMAEAVCLRIDKFIYTNGEE